MNISTNIKTSNLRLKRKTIQYCAEKTLPTHSYIVPIQSGSGLSPLFMVHSIAGELTWAKHLARNLGPAQPIYIFAAPGLNSEAPFFFSLEAMASAYLRDIRATQPSGPYLLGGYSMGGVIAFEMAKQLETSGEEVRLLAMIDSFAPLAEHMDSITAWSRNGLLLQVISNQLALQWKADQLLPPDALPQLPFSEHSKCATQHLLAHCDIPHSNSILQAYLRRSQVMMRVHAQLLSDYKPTPLKRPLKLVLFRNTLGLIGHHSALNLPILPDSERDPPHRWDALLQSPAISIDVPEEHFMLGGEPAIGFISQTLKELLMCAQNSSVAPTA